MHARDPDDDLARAVGARKRQPSLAGERLVVLGNLIALRQVGIEIILAGKHGLCVDPAAQRERRANRKLDRAPVEHGQRARQPETHRTHRRVRRRAKRRPASAEDLGVRQQLSVDLEADDGFERHRTTIVVLSPGKFRVRPGVQGPSKSSRTSRVRVLASSDS